MDWKDALSRISGLPEGDSQSTATPQEAPRSARRGRLVVDKERKGRAGKVAIIISGFTCDDAEIADIAADIKRKLGTGGSARGGEILIQGDRRDDVVAALRALGFTVN